MVVEHKINGETIRDEVEIYTQSQVGDDFPEDFAIPVTEDVYHLEMNRMQIYGDPQSNSKLVKN